MTRTQIYVPTELYQQAKAMALLSNMTISQLVREGLERVVADKHTALPKNQLAHLAGMFKSKSGKKTNVAAHHNDIYTI